MNGMGCAEDPWPTLEAALAESEIIAEHARSFFGEALESVWMYGSRARGEQRPDSDLDLLLVRTLPKRPDPTRLDWAFVEHLDKNVNEFDALFTRISIHSVEPDRFRTWDTMFFRGVREDGIRIL